MAVVIKFAVVGLQGFDAERIREAGVLEQYAVLRGKKSVVFSHPAIIVGFIPIYADIAEQAGMLGLSSEQFNRAQMQALAFAETMAW